MAASNAFKASLVINPDLRYCRFRLACIDHVLGHYDDAIEGFQSILKAEPRYIPALQGEGEAWLAVAKDQLSRGLSYAAATSISRGIAPVVKALAITSQFQCVWKLLGDLCNISYAVPLEQMVKQPLPDDVQQFLSGPNPYDERDHLLRLGGLAYTTAAKYVEPSMRGLVLGDIALNMLLRAHRLAGDRRVGGADKGGAEALKADAFAAIKQALRLQPSSSALWDVLGLIAFAIKVGKRHD